MKKNLIIGSIVFVVVIILVIIGLFLLQNKNEVRYESIELTGRYFEGEHSCGVKWWGTDCWIIEENGTKHEVTCYCNDTLHNKTMRIKRFQIMKRKVVAGLFFNSP